MRIKRLDTASLNDPEEGISFRKTSDETLVVEWRDYGNVPAHVTFDDVDRFAYQIEPFSAIEGVARHEGSFVEVIDSDYLRDFVAANYESEAPELRLFYLSTNIGEWCDIVALRCQTD